MNIAKPSCISRKFWDLQINFVFYISGREMQQKVGCVVDIPMAYQHFLGRNPNGILLVFKMTLNILDAPGIHLHNRSISPAKFLFVSWVFRDCPWKISSWNMMFFWVSPFFPWDMLKFFFGKKHLPSYEILRVTSPKSSLVGFNFSTAKKVGYIGYTLPETNVSPLVISTKHVFDASLKELIAKACAG